MKQTALEGSYLMAPALQGRHEWKSPGFWSSVWLLSPFIFSIPHIEW
jgi:hypothetical protein